MNVLQVTDLTKTYRKGLLAKRTEVLKRLSLSVPAGKITGFLGANGAGKTTTMRCILGLDYPDSGQVQFFGAPLSVQSRRRIGFLPERPYFYEYLTGTEFLEFYAQLNGDMTRTRVRERITELLRRVDLSHAKDRLLRTYSKGMLQRIGLAQALIHGPEFVILDEPMSGLDPDGRLALAEIILETAKSGTAVFFTSHLLHDTERLCERLIVIKDGQNLYEGSTEDLLNRSHMGFEISFSQNGRLESRNVKEQEQAQKELHEILRNGGQVLEVRRRRLTLEEVFVQMALRGGRSS